MKEAGNVCFGKGGRGNAILDNEALCNIYYELPERVVRHLETVAKWEMSRSWL